MDLFGFKKRKADKEAQLKGAANMKALKLQKVKAEFAILKKRAEDLANEQNKEDQYYSDLTNNKCPKCNSKNVNDRIQRIQGEFSGSISGSRSLFSGSLYGSSSGRIDTNGVNKCNDCGNEWKKRETDFTYWKSVLEKMFQQLDWMLEEYYKAYSAKLNPDDLEEHYTTNEEKKEDLLKEADGGWRRKGLLPFFQGIHIETIKETAEKEIWDSSYDRYGLESFYEHWNEKILETKLSITHMQL